MKTLSANTQYALGFSVCMILYVVALFASLGLITIKHPTGALLYATAVLPALPIGGTIIVFLRYIDQVDEYVRGVMLKRFIVATGLTLFICTAWGFIEENASGHHFSLYLVYPLFWMMFALSSSIYRKVL